MAPRTRMAMYQKGVTQALVVQNSLWKFI